MKFLITITLSLFSISAWSQNEIVYVPKKKNYDLEVLNYFLGSKNSEGLIQILKKEVKRQELGAFDSKLDIRFEFASDFSAVSKKRKDNSIMVMGVPENLALIIDTSDGQITGYSCENELSTVKNVLGEDSVVFNVDTKEYQTITNEIRNCSYYYSIDGIDGIVLIEGFEVKTTEDENKLGIKLDSYYTKPRIGFVKTVNFYNPVYGEYESIQCITFSSTVDALAEITGKSDVNKMYKKLRKHALKDKENTNGKAGSDRISIFNYDEINEISNFFISDTSGTVKDPHFGITLFKY
jgi:hypothetical protein